MNHRSPWSDKPPRRLGARLDHAMRDVNAVLLVFAIGLAVLDFTCFFAFEVRSALPSAARASAGPAVMAPAAISAQQSTVMLTPTGTGTATGW